MMKAHEIMLYKNLNMMILRKSRICVNLIITSDWSFKLELQNVVVNN